MPQGSPGCMNYNPGSTGGHQQHVWEHRQKAFKWWGDAWEHLEQPSSSLGKTTSSLGMWMGLLKVTATAHCSTIFQTLVFTFYSHPYIYVSTYLCIYGSLDMWCYPSTQSISGLARAILESNCRYAWRWGLSDLIDALGGSDLTSLNMH